ncbi:isoprenylcysteine carboxylmethyltransferase family protein [candidate division WOR-3 bacterium]|nr:isoprenylcysteine carboxylmethyltransferase family protein [candidate division WOR-3 bacterium]
MKKTHQYHFLDFVAYALMILCFPLNPLVFLNAIKPQPNNILTVFGFIFWTIGMIFVVYPFFYLKIMGNVPKGKSYVHTEKLVTTGLYSIIRHVQYTGGILSIFIATPLLYPHPIFVILGIPGIYLTYLGMKREDSLMVEKFGEEYREYMKKVPAMNLFLGIFNKFRKDK